MNRAQATSAGPDESAIASYPLFRRFATRFLPGFALFAALFLGTVTWTTQDLARTVYLQQAQRRADTIARAVANAVPAIWQDFIAGTGRLSPDDTRALSDGFAQEAQEMGLSELKVYDLNRRVLYATHASEIGGIENGEALISVLTDGNAQAARKALPDGGDLYELYVPLVAGDGSVAAVFELYEPVGRLDTVLLRATATALAGPGVLLLVLLGGLTILVRGAQSQIDARTDAVNALQRRIRSLLSRNAARAVSSDPELGPKRMDTTLFYSDIRGFTGFSESNAPADVMAFLDRIMDLQITELEARDGDVDKMIGDAVLARFDGPDGPKRAFAAARAIQARLRRENVPQGIGIGIHRGPVIAGGIGPAARRDYTVIGDTVNVVARFSDLAATGEIVIDAGLAETLLPPGPDRSETVALKGRTTPAQVVRVAA